MKWSHLYIPVLPRSLSPMLDAPMPYLCGISRENFQYAVGDIGDDAIVVDLDRNMITLGSNPIDLPPLPHKHRMKLENALQSNVGESFQLHFKSLVSYGCISKALIVPTLSSGHVFWEARGMTKEDATAILNSSDEEYVNTTLENAHSIWNEKIRTVDDAYGLAPAPESTTIAMNVDPMNTKQSKWDAVQEAFLRFYVSALKVSALCTYPV